MRSSFERSTADPFKGPEDLTAFDELSKKTSSPRGHSRRRSRLNKRLSICLSAFTFFLALFIRGFAASQTGVLSGTVHGIDGRPLAGVAVSLSSAETPFRLRTPTDLKGNFWIAGIPPGKHSISFAFVGYHSREETSFLIEPRSILHVRVTLIPEGETGVAAPATIWTDLTDPTTMTIISQNQVRLLPSAQDFWSVIENQDLSATTNRIDVGGTWADRPALWSSRGGVSWTQSRYLLNGMDVTDPYYGGTPLFFPDFGGFSFYHHSSGRHPIEDLSPGGYIDLTPREGTSEFHGALAAFLTLPGMTSKNITPALQVEGLDESHRLNSFSHYSVGMSGPIVPGRSSFQAAFSHLTLNRDLAEFEPADRGRIASGLVNLSFHLGGGCFRFFWTGQAVKNPTSGAGRRIPFSSTLNREDRYHIFQALWQGRAGPRHFFEFGGSYSGGDFESRFQDGINEPHGVEIFRRISRGAAPMAGRDSRRNFVLRGRADSFLPELLGFSHRLEYGFTFRHASASAEKVILNNLHLHFLGDEPLEIVRFDTPVQDREKSVDLQLFAQDTVNFGNLASISFGLHLVSTRGSSVAPAWRSTNPAFGGGSPATEDEGKIRWLNLSPRLSVALPLLNSKSFWLRISCARYFYELPLYFLTYGNSASLGGLAYPWKDANGDRKFQEGEEGSLWRREGPAFSRIDPDLERPRTDEYAVSLTKFFGRTFVLTFAGFYRQTRNLVETVNTGVPLDAYSKVSIYDPGDNRIPGDHDDLNLTVFNQNADTLGRDFFLLTNPKGPSPRVTRYRGLDLTLVKKFSPMTVFFFSATATEAVGTTSPGNTEWENDDNIVGALDDNPNALLFARGRVRFDRAYTARLGMSFPLPLGFRLAALAKYYDGQPFARKIIVTGLNQGPFYVQAFPRGVARYEFNLTLDIRLEKSLKWGPGKGRIFLEGYNILNLAQATEENEWTGPEFPLRYATEVQSPRVFRLGIGYEF